jgi:predicted XRE-type DNA-binding protein
MPLVSPELELLNQRSLAQRAVAAYAAVFQPLLSALIRT